MKIHCLFNWELEDGDSEACLIKCTLPCRAWTGEAQRFSTCQWKTKAFCSLGVPEKKTVNVQHQPLNYNSSTLQSNGSSLWRTRGEAPLISRRDEFAILPRGCFYVWVLASRNVRVRRVQVKHLHSPPLCVHLRPPVANQHSEAGDRHTKALTFTHSAFRSPLEP